VTAHQFDLDIGLAQPFVCSSAAGRLRDRGFLGTLPVVEDVQQVNYPTLLSH
jgi:hypothetical protein